MAFLAPVYELRLGGALPGFAAPVTLAIYAEDERTYAGRPPVIARFDEAIQRWQPLATGWEGESRVASTAVSEAGFYALLAGDEAVEMRLYLPAIRN